MNKIFRRCLFSILVMGMVACNEDGGMADNGLHERDATSSYLWVGPNATNVRNVAGELDVVVSTNRVWTVVSQVEWISLSKVQGTGDAILKLEYGENPENDKREGTVTFSIEGVEPIVMTVVQTDTYFTNPLGDIPDPWITKYQNAYYLCKAQGDNQVNISSSTKLTLLSGTTTVWRAPSDAGAVKPWNVSHLWAPELHYIEGSWYIYYTAGRPHAELNRYNQRSGVLRSKTTDPFGQWEDMGMLYTGDSYSEGIVPTVENTYSGIDLTTVMIDGQRYAVWSGTPTEADADQAIYIARMSNPYTISSNRVRITTADQPWELFTRGIQEGPAILKRGSKTFIVYSCNGSWTKYYRLGYIVLENPSLDPMVVGNWKKSANQVFYRCDDTLPGVTGVDGVNGVGHCSFTTSPDGTEDWIVYHVKKRNDATYESGRSTFVQRFTWNADDTPNFGYPVGWGELVPVPSGQK
ncbi:Extracellular exo-alpha-(1-_5)-L-arabinofuranosidase [termite gut metagenome]|uniref:Extracellular exo-alpha-(1->5)-L-arabinofuranosidase n=1 Tax=termite gut metagenome TaxID=433724 RepID=A0A5J4SFH8_9ZZZZ